MTEPVRLAYLVSQYPAVNHTFILREIVGLRSVGFDIRTIAIRGADRPAAQMTETERDEQARTLTVLPFGKRFLTAHLHALARRPARYIAGFRYALGMAAAGPKSLVYHAIYFAEAVAAGYAAEQSGCKHLHTHFASTVALIAAKVFDLDLSITIHGPDEFRDVIAFRMRQKVAHARFISTISHYARSQIMLASEPADWPKVEVCRLGVDPQVFSPIEESPLQPPFRIVCVGRLAPVKAQRLLITACARLIETGRDLRLHLVGHGPDRQALEAHAASLEVADKVIFEGPRNQDEVIALYRRSHVFALASFAEGVPVVLMEAMSMKLPCVSTWVNGIPELIAHEQEGLLVAPSAAGQLADAIARLLDNEAERRSLGERARERILREYDLARNTGILAEVFRRRLRDQSATVRAASSASSSTN